jgi:hypothetical protein
MVEGTPLKEPKKREKEVAAARAAGIGVLHLYSAIV